MTARSVSRKTSCCRGLRKRQMKEREGDSRRGGSVSKQTAQRVSQKKILRERQNFQLKELQNGSWLSSSGSGLRAGQGGCNMCKEGAGALCSAVWGTAESTPVLFNVHEHYQMIQATANITPNSSRNCNMMTGGEHWILNESCSSTDSQGWMLVIIYKSSARLFASRPIARPIPPQPLPPNLSSDFL